MPRSADPETHTRRRAQLVDAVFRIVRRDGIEGASVRAVAREAGLSMGSLRYYFATQAELLAFALDEVERRMRARIAGLDTTGDPRDVLEAVLAQLVPMTPESRVEHEIWLAFAGRAVSDAALRAQNVRVYDELRALCRELVELAEPAEGERELLTDELFALVDGAALHAVQRPEAWPPERLAALLRRRVDALLGAGGRP